MTNPMSNADPDPFVPFVPLVPIDGLAGRVRGPVLRPGDDGYDIERGGFQTAYRHRPGVIVGAVEPGDVRVAVDFAGAHGLPVAVQATGHGLSVPAAGGLLVSTRRMTGVRVDGGARTAWIEPGARWAKVVAAAARYGLAPLSGSAPDTGAVGYTLGGGLGPLGRKHGYAVDRVQAIDVVTPDARPRHVTPDTEPDLFWALRGGRDNFGVVTGLRIGLVPVTRLYGGGLYFDGAFDGAKAAADVLHAYVRWTETLPDELTSSVGLVPFPDVDAVPAPLRGRYVAHVRVAYLGDAAAGERLVAPLRAAGPILIDALREMPYTESGSIHNDPPAPHGYTGSNVLLRAFDDDTARAVLDLAGAAAPVPCVVELRHLGGALARAPEVASAVGHRAAPYLLRVLSPVSQSAQPAQSARPSSGPGEDEGHAMHLVRTVHETHRRVFAAVAPWSAGGGRSLNFIYGDSATADQVRAAYEPTGLRRLTALKAVYDPGNMFRLNHNIPPGPPAH